MNRIAYHSPSVDMLPLHQNRIQGELFVHTSPTSHTKSKRKVVSFASSPSQVVVLPATDEDELQTKWYSKQEYAEFKSAMVKKIAAMKAGNSTEYSRGLELMTPVALQNKKNTKVKLLAAVWNGQVRQWNEQNRIYDPVSIALACQRETFQCVQLAWTLGQLDQQAAMEEYQSMLFGDQHQHHHQNHQTNQYINSNNKYSGRGFQNQSNSYIGGDLQKGSAPGEPFSNQTNYSCGGEDLKKLPVGEKCQTVGAKRTSKPSPLDGSLESPSKKLNAMAA